jgi:hypothetical protein
MSDGGWSDQTHGGGGGGGGWSDQTHGGGGGWSDYHGWEHAGNSYTPPPKAKMPVGGTGITSILGTAMWFLAALTFLFIRVSFWMYSDRVCKYVATMKKNHPEEQAAADPCNSGRGFVDFMMWSSMIVMGMCVFMLLFVFEHNYRS